MRLNVVGFESNDNKTTYHCIDRQSDNDKTITNFKYLNIFFIFNIVIVTSLVKVFCNFLELKHKK